MLGLFFQFKDYFNRFLAKLGPSKQRKHRNPMTYKDLLPIKQWPRKLGPAILPIDHWSRQLDQPCSPLEHRSRKSGHGFSYTTLEHWQDIQRLWNSLHTTLSIIPSFKLALQNSKLDWWWEIISTGIDTQVISSQYPKYHPSGSGNTRGKGLINFWSLRMRGNMLSEATKLRALCFVKLFLLILMVSSENCKSLV